MCKGFFRKLARLGKKVLYNEKWTCAGCGKENFNGEYFCDECKSNLPIIEDKFCLHCGRKTIATENYCSTCKNNMISIDLGRSVFDYKPPIKELIGKFKSYEYKYLANLFCDYMAEFINKDFACVDVITFVPMTKKAKNKRGFNQAELLAKGMQERCDIPCEKLMEKVKETKSQKSLTKLQRHKNLQEAFKVIDKSKIKDKTILIIDDVTTTGSTLECMAYKLKKAKAKNIYFLTVASVQHIEGY